MTALLTVGFIYAQVYNCPDSAAFSLWTVYDKDGDGKNWGASVINNSQITAPGFNGSSGFLSASWSTNPLTPDNLAISPVIDCSANTTLFLNWMAGSPETTASGWYQEKYAVYVVTQAQIAVIIATNVYPTPVFETILTAGETFFSESVDISSVAGSQSAVHVILRHYDCTNENWIFVKNLSVTTTQPAGLNEASIEALVYPNPAINVLNIETTAAANSVSIISMDGKVVSSTAMSGLKGSVDVSNLKEGVYFYEVAIADGSVVRNTFVKQ